MQRQQIQLPGYAMSLPRGQYPQMQLPPLPTSADRIKKKLKPRRDVDPPAAESFSGGDPYSK